MLMPHRAALLAIDMQSGFDTPRWGRRNNPALDANGQRLLQGWRARGWPIIHVRHDSIDPGSTLHPSHPGNAARTGFAPQHGEPLVVKSVNSALIGTDLDLRLRRLALDTVVLFGISTDMCVSTTARHAANLGYRTVVVADACACFDLRALDGAAIDADTVAAVHLATLQAEFATVCSTADALAALGSADAA